MKRNECVYIAENPARRAACFRHVLKMDPVVSERDDATPYYLEDGRENESFTEEERQAIVSLHPKEGALLVKHQAKDGAISFSVVDDKIETIRSLYDNEFLVAHEIVAQFLFLLGGKNVKVESENQRELNLWERVRRKICGDVTGKAIGKTGAGASDSSSQEQEQRLFAQAMSSVEGTTADFRKAHEFLDRFAWMKQSFGLLLDAVENGRLHGKYEKDFGQEFSRNIREKYRQAVDVAARYKIVSVKVKERFEKECEKREKGKDHWRLSMELP